MTTAHRPTWNSARGDSALAGSKLVQPKRNYSALDMPAHLKLKERQPGQGDSSEQSEIDFKSQLLREERDRELKKKGITILNDDEDEYVMKRLRTGIATSVTIKTPFPQDADEKFEDSSDEEKESEEDKESSEESEEDDDEDDDELELLREYAKIKREREEEQRRKEIEKMQEIKKK